MKIITYTENTFECLHEDRECKVEKTRGGRYYITVLDVKTGTHDYDGWYDTINATMVDAINNMIIESELFKEI